MSISASLLNSWVTLQKPLIVKDTLGGVKTDYTSIAKVRANVTTDSMNEKVLDKQVQSEIVYNIQIRPLKGVILDTTWRIILDNKVMCIEGVDHLVRKDVVILARFKSSEQE